MYSDFQTIGISNRLPLIWIMLLNWGATRAHYSLVRPSPELQNVTNPADNACKKVAKHGKMWVIFMGVKAYLQCFLRANYLTF